MPLRSSIVHVLKSAVELHALASQGTITPLSFIIDKVSRTAVDAAICPPPGESCVHQPESFSLSMTTRSIFFFACGTDFALLAETPMVETASASPKPIESFLNSPLFVDV